MAVGELPAQNGVPCVCRGCVMEITWLQDRAGCFVAGSSVQRLGCIGRLSRHVEMWRDCTEGKVRS